MILAACSPINVDYITRLWLGNTIFTLDVPNIGNGAQRSLVPKFFSQPLGFAGETIRTGDALYAFEGGHKYMILRKDGVNHKIVCSGYLSGQDRSFFWTVENLRNCDLENILLT